jgi:hypothetical protein
MNEDELRRSGASETTLGNQSMLRIPVTLQPLRLQRANATTLVRAMALAFPISISSSKLLAGGKLAAIALIFIILLGEPLLSVFFHVISSTNVSFCPNIRLIDSLIASRFLVV